MAQTVRDIDTGKVHRVEDVDTASRDTVDRSANIAARVISLIGGIIIALLGLRFIFMLLGANRGNALVDFIYTASRPFAAPFFGIFNYQEQFGQSRFEFETLIAILVYALITWALIQIVSMGDRESR